MLTIRLDNYVIRSSTKLGDTRDIDEPTYKSFNLPTRLSTYLQDINQTAYNTFDSVERLPTNHGTRIRPQTRLSTKLQDFEHEHWRNDFEYEQKNIDL